MNNSSALVTIALLSTMLDRKQNDYLDMISPFVLTLLPTKIGEKVDDDKIITELKEKYGFEEFPHHVLTKILRRFCGEKYGYLRQDYGALFVKKVYEESDKFYNNRRKIREAHSKVMEKLQSYLQRNTRYKTITIENTRELFLSFLERKGLILVNEINDLKTIISRNDYESFHVARFVIEEYENMTDTYLHIEEVVRGFFVYKAIYMFSKGDTATLSDKLKNTSVFFDTRLLIEALGYNTEKGSTASRELISMIVNNGGKVMTFSHLVDEVRGILTAFENDPYKGVSFSLQYLSDNHYGCIDIKRLKNTLLTNLGKIGIEIVDAVEVGLLEKDEFAPLELNDLKYAMHKTYGNKSPESRLYNDVHSIASIYHFRGNKRCTSLQDCHSIMVTPNLGFVKTVCDFYKESYSREIGFVMSDIDITALLWLQTWDKKSKLPSIILLENAYAACCLSQNTFEAFCETIERLKKEGTFTEEEALMLRTQKAPRDDLLHSSQNDIGFVNEKTVKEIRDRYVGNLTKGEREKNATRKKDAINKAEGEAKKIADKIGRIVNIVIGCIGVIVFSYGVYALHIGQSGGGNCTWLGLVALCIAIVGFYDSMRSRSVIIERVTNRIKNWVFQRIHDKEIAKINDYFHDI